MDGQLKRLIVAQSAIPLTVGLLCVLGGAWLLSRQLESLLYEVRARDATTYAAESRRRPTTVSRLIVRVPW